MRCDAIQGEDKNLVDIMEMEDAGLFTHLLTSDMLQMVELMLICPDSWELMITPIT